MCFVLFMFGNSITSNNISASKSGIFIIKLKVQEYIMKRGVVLITGLILLSGFINSGNSNFVQLSQSNHLSFSSNESTDGNISGCTDESANNYNQNATDDDGTCIDPPSGGFVYSKSVEIFNNTNSSTHGVQSKIKFSNNEDFFAANDFTNLTVWDSANTNEIISIESSGRILDFDWSLFHSVLI